MKTDKTPLVFISYSWTPEIYANKVKEIAVRLVSNGIDVKFDKWDNIPGKDLYSYMEGSVNNPEVDFVLLMCTQDYANKADDRSRGVGVETQIIAPNVYNSTEESKFIPVILEKDATGIPYKPSYVKSRIHIDLSEDASFEENFEALVRAIYRKPLEIKPKLGQPPVYITTDNIDYFQSLSKFRAFENALKNGKTTDIEYFHDFKEAFIEDLRQFEIDKSIVLDLPQDETEAKIRVKINDTKPFTLMFEQLSKDMALYWDKIGKEEILSFLESFLSYAMMQCDFYRKETSKYDPRPQVLEYLLYEFMLIFCTYLLMNMKYSELDLLLSRQYQVFYESNHTMSTVYHTYLVEIFNRFPVSLANNAKSLRINPHTYLNNYVSSRLSYLKSRDLVESDMILSIISFIKIDKEKRNVFWNPFITFNLRDIRLFRLMDSKSRFDEAKIIFHVEEPMELSNLIERYFGDPYRGMRFADSMTYYEFATIP